MADRAEARRGDAALRVDGPDADVRAGVRAAGFRAEVGRVAPAVAVVVLAARLVVVAARFAVLAARLAVLLAELVARRVVVAARRVVVAPRDAASRASFCTCLLRPSRRFKALSTSACFAVRRT
ncbi:MAG: hypothetical protein ACYDA0_02990 [Candidatus Dormibacteraceae bacterium]